jgi:hypothetical protein
VEIGTEAAQFPEKEYIDRIFLAVCHAVIDFKRKISFGFRQENVEGDCGSWFSEEELGRTSILSIHSLFP